MYSCLRVFKPTPLHLFERFRSGHLVSALLCIACRHILRVHPLFCRNKSSLLLLRPRNSINRSCFANGGRPTLVQPMQQHVYPGNIQRHTKAAVTGSKLGRARKPRKYHADLGTRAGLHIHIPDRYTRHDITPYVDRYDAVTRRRFLTSERIPVEQQCSLLLKYILS